MAKDRRRIGFGPGSAIDPHKHETPQDRTRRHQAIVERVREKFTPGGFDVTAWLAMHREAENATIFDPRKYTPAFLNKGGA